MKENRIYFISGQCLQYLEDNKVTEGTLALSREISHSKRAVSFSLTSRSERGLVNSTNGAV